MKEDVTSRERERVIKIPPPETEERKKAPLFPPAPAACHGEIS